MQFIGLEAAQAFDHNFGRSCVETPVLSRASSETVARIESSGRSHERCVVGVTYEGVMLETEDVGRDTSRPNDAPSSASGRFLIRSVHSVRIVSFEQVQSVEAANQYVRLHVGDGSHLLRGSMLAVARQLGTSFIRIHRSHIVRVDQIQEIRRRPNGHYELLLMDERWVPVGRTYLASVRRALGL